MKVALCHNTELLWILLHERALWTALTKVLIGLCNSLFRPRLASFLFQLQDFRLLFHKCALLHSQNRVEEFLETGMELFKLFFSDVYDNKWLTGLFLF